MRILKDKKGIALENAILFMLVIFSLCFLIASLTLTGHYQTKIDDILLDQKVELDQIGEDYLASVKSGSEFNETYENFSYKVEGDLLKVWRGTDQTKPAVLYVQAELVDENLKVTRWCYSDPNPTE